MHRRNCYSRHVSWLSGACQLGNKIAEGEFVPRTFCWRHITMPNDVLQRDVVFATQFLTEANYRFDLRGSRPGKSLCPALVIHATKVTHDRNSKIRVVSRSMCAFAAVRAALLDRAVG